MKLTDEENANLRNSPGYLEGRARSRILKHLNAADIDEGIAEIEQLRWEIDKKQALIDVLEESIEEKDDEIERLRAWTGEAYRDGYQQAMVDNGNDGHFTTPEKAWDLSDVKHDAIETGQDSLETQELRAQVEELEAENEKLRNIEIVQEGSHIRVVIGGSEALPFTIHKMPANDIALMSDITLIQRLRHPDLFAEETDEDYQFGVAGRAADEIERLRDAKQAIVDSYAHEVCELKAQVEELERTHNADIGWISRVERNVGILEERNENYRKRVEELEAGGGVIRTVALLECPNEFVLYASTSSGDHTRAEEWFKSQRARVEKLEAALEFALEAPSEIQKLMRDVDIVIDDLEGRMRKFAFAVYAKLVAVSDAADRELEAEDE